MSRQGKDSAPSIKKALNNVKLALGLRKPTEEELMSKPIRIKTSGSPSDCRRINDIAARLSKIPDGKLLLETAYRNDCEIMIVPDMSARGVYNNEKKRIFLSSNLSDDKLIDALAHELRHATQAKAGLEFEPETLSPDVEMVLNRVKEADANVFSALCCWKLKEIGDTKPWEEFKKSFKAIAEPFEEKMQQNAPIKEAMYAAFKGWYANMGVRNFYDKLQTDRIEKMGEYGRSVKSSFSKRIELTEIVQRACQFGKENYFGDNPEILKTPAYFSMEPTCLDRIKKYFEKRLRFFGLKPPKGLDNMYEHGNEPKQQAALNLAVLNKIAKSY